MARAFVGTSGYNYRGWRGSFYPEKMPTRAWLGFYAQHFASVELNVTFYRLPPPEVFRAWARRVGPEFAFVLKGSRLITHRHRLRDVEPLVAAFFDHASELGRRLACVLWQLPPQMPADLERLDAFLAALAEHGQGARQAFEFRHPSWFAPAIAQRLARAGAAVALADWPLQVLGPGQRPRKLAGARPLARVPELGPFVYVRRHGPGARYASPYSPAMLRSDAAWVARWLAEGRDVFAFYNNDNGGFAPRNAASLARRIEALTRPATAAEEPPREPRRAAPRAG